jgi:hypothetical protein
MAGVRFLPPLMVISLVCVVIAVALLAFGNRDSEQGADQVRQINELVALSQKIPSQASAALSGNEPAFDALAKSQQRYSRLAESEALRTQAIPGSTDLLKQTQGILGAREATLAVAEAATDVRTLVPQLLQNLGTVASSLGPTGVDAMSRHLERFELTGLRLQHDMEALSTGLGDATLVARRLADGIDYMGQVIAGLRGQDSACRRSPAPIWMPSSKPRAISIHSSARTSVPASLRRNVFAPRARRTRRWPRARNRSTRTSKIISAR